MEYSSYSRAAEIISKARRVTAFTGAGISVESGIPPFRGEGGLWNMYDPESIYIDNFFANPLECWVKIKEIFYNFFGQAHPNDAHFGLAKLENAGLLKTVITQNIDNLHQEAGSREIYEFHGTSSYLICTVCLNRFHKSEIDLDSLPPHCANCGGLLKPDFVFFGEPIPEKPYIKAIQEASDSDVFLVIGTTGEVAPASSIPIAAKRNGSQIIEINPNRSNFTGPITDVFLQDKASRAMNDLTRLLKI